MTFDEICRFEDCAVGEALVTGESLVATTNALSAFVVGSGTGTRKPTMNAGDGGSPKRIHRGYQCHAIPPATNAQRAVS